MGGQIKRLPRPFNRWTTYPGHSGIDYPEPNNAVVMASGDGVVIQSGFWNIRGGYGVIIRYDNGVELGYCHADEEDFRIGVGKRVKLGTRIMTVGKLGLNSTGYHLHNDVRVNGVIIPPPRYWDYVDGSLNGYVVAPSFAATVIEDEMIIAIPGKKGVRTNATWITKNGRSHKLSSSRLLSGAVRLTTDAEIKKFFDLYPQA